MIRRGISLMWSAAVLCAVITAAAVASDAPASAAYAYATNGIEDHIAGALDSRWKLLLDESDLGGRELEMAEVALAPGTVVGSHTHRSVEVIYVLSGTYEHEVNGKRYRLTPGMVGIVRPGDHVRHLVPKSGPAKLLIIWAPAGEAGRLLAQGKGTAVRPLSLIEAALP
jgi:quercetin dioxygenase-like cupin family protein